MKISEKLLELAKNKYGYESDVLELVADYSGVDDCAIYDQLDNLSVDAINSQEIIYSSSAMEFLAKNDPSLSDSLTAAAEMCFDLKKLNSEILATIILRDNLFDAWYNLKDEVAALFETESEE